jgi:hypothetical protein
MARTWHHRDKRYGQSNGHGSRRPWIKKELNRRARRSAKINADSEWRVVKRLSRKSVGVWAVGSPGAGRQIGVWYD